MTLAAELAALSEKATQGEWENSRGFVRSKSAPQPMQLAENVNVQVSCTWVAETTRGEGYVPGNGNADFIAALVNAYRSGHLRVVEDARPASAAQEARWQGMGEAARMCDTAFVDECNAGDVDELFPDNAWTRICAKLIRSRIEQEKINAAAPAQGEDK